MTRSTKTQQQAKPKPRAKAAPKTAKKADKSPGAQTDPETIATHFMNVWHDQWQDFLRDHPTMVTDMQKIWAQPSGSPLAGFGFPGNFGQYPNHAPPQKPADNDPTALELATAALAASGQCLELLKQCGQRLDDVAKRIDALDRTTPQRRTPTAQASKTKRPRT